MRFAIPWLRMLCVVGCALLAACQNTESSFDGENFSAETRSLDRQLMREAAALGTAQAAVGMVGMYDPTGLSSLATIPAGLAAREAMRRSADRRMEEQLNKDEAAFYRRWGMHPDGTPSGKKPEGL